MYWTKIVYNMNTPLKASSRVPILLRVHIYILHFLSNLIYQRGKSCNYVLLGARLLHAHMYRNTIDHFLRKNYFHLKSCPRSHQYHHYASNPFSKKCTREKHHVLMHVQSTSTMTWSSMYYQFFLPFESSKEQEWINTPIDSSLASLIFTFSNTWRKTHILNT